MNPAKSQQRLYAMLLALGACILLYRTARMISLGAFDTLVIWVSSLLVAELRPVVDPE